MPSLSICMMVQNSEKTLPIVLESLNSVYDELIIIDGGSNDNTCKIALKYGSKIIHSPWSGNHSQQRNVYLEYVSCDWVFVIDSDEFINIKTLNFLKQLKANHIKINTDNFWISRKWISSFSKDYYITSKPHYPDFQRRLFKYNKNIFYTGQIHESIQNLEDRGQCLSELSIYHLDLFINNEEQRIAKVRKYSRIDPRDGGRHYYLPNKHKLQVEKWNENEISDSVKDLLNGLTLNKNIEKSGLNQIIPPEIKNDNFYYTIEKIAQREDILTVLEIGSSSGEGSTEALVNGLSRNCNKPILFCLEISKNRFIELQKKYLNKDFVKCYNISSVSFKDFPSENEVLNFYRNYKTNLNFYSLEDIIGWLKQDIEYLQESRVSDEGIKKIKQENNITFFDLVVIDGSEFTGNAELKQVYGAKFICLDDINTFKNFKNHHDLLLDNNYELFFQDNSIRNGCSIFKRKLELSQIFIQQEEFKKLPVHFFTIVLNGQPFIRYHINIFKQLPFLWHWHIIEGVADLKYDTAWSVNNGGYVSEEIHRNGYSIDGTKEYLDELAQQYPDNITIYRKPIGLFWDGKREMVNEPLSNIQEECLLWQIDVDEFWTAKQISTARLLFLNNPDKTAAFYWCWYFVGEKLVISTRNCYAQNPQQEWLRTWRYKPGAVWVAHEPPRLEEPLLNGQWQDVAKINPFLHQETENNGLIFQHFAYVTESQVHFKEQYYGYKNAVYQWEALQKQNQFPVLLRQYFAWVQDDTLADTTESCGVIPLIQKDINANIWQFLDIEDIQNKNSNLRKTTIKIVIDSVFFQFFQTGIARVWKSLLEEWSNNGFARYIIVLDRANTAPKISGIRYRIVPPYDYGNTNADREMLQQICDEEGAELFISSYYTTPITTPSVFMAYDMIPEVMGWDVSQPMWQQKYRAIQHASAHVAISENTARDLVKFFPNIPLESVTVAYCGVKSTFSPINPEEIQAFKVKYGISKPYFILVGAGAGYKNSSLFFQAFSQLVSKCGFDIVCTGSGGTLAPEWRAYTSGSVVHMLQLSDEELAIAYSGAAALVYPSKYEGFGMPVAEAMACGCPVITCPSASIPEVAGEAAIYVSGEDVNELANALCDVQKPEVRQRLVTLGLEQAKKFSWSKMAATVSTALIEATLLPLKLREVNLIIFPDWLQPEESLQEELERVIEAIATSTNSKQTTLLINNSQISHEDAELFVSGVTMNLLMHKDIDFIEELEISLLGELADIQWQALLPRIQARIPLVHENHVAIAKDVFQMLIEHKL